MKISYSTFFLLTIGSIVAVHGISLTCHDNLINVDHDIFDQWKDYNVLATNGHQLMFAYPKSKCCYLLESGSGTIRVPMEATIDLVDAGAKYPWTSLNTRGLRIFNKIVDQIDLLEQSKRQANDILFNFGPVQDPNELSAFERQFSMIKNTQKSIEAEIAKLGRNLKSLEI